MQVLEDFTGCDLTTAVDRFLAGRWAESAERFTLILAQNTIRSLDEPWVKAQRKLSAHGTSLLVTSYSCLPLQSVKAHE